MNLEKHWLQQLNRLTAFQPTTEEEIKEQESNIEVIAENLEWIANVKKMAKDSYIESDEISEESWIEGYVVGFAHAAKLAEENNYETYNEE
jgi:hypothetical protein